MSFFVFLFFFLHLLLLEMWRSFFFVFLLLSSQCKETTKQVISCFGIVILVYKCPLNFPHQIEKLLTFSIFLFILYLFSSRQFSLTFPYCYHFHNRIERLIYSHRSYVATPETLWRSWGKKKEKYGKGNNMENGRKICLCIM